MYEALAITVLLSVCFVFAFVFVQIVRQVLIVLKDGGSFTSYKIICDKSYHSEGDLPRYRVTIEKYFMGVFSERTSTRVFYDLNDLSMMAKSYKDNFKRVKVKIRS